MPNVWEKRKIFFVIAGENHDFDLPDLRMAEKEKQKSQNGDA